MDCDDDADWDEDDYSGPAEDDVEEEAEDEVEGSWEPEYSGHGDGDEEEDKEDDYEEEYEEDHCEDEDEEDDYVEEDEEDGYENNGYGGEEGEECCHHYEHNEEGEHDDSDDKGTFLRHVPIMSAEAIKDLDASLAGWFVADILKEANMNTTKDCSPRVVSHLVRTLQLLLVHPKFQCLPLIRYVDDMALYLTLIRSCQHNTAPIKACVEFLSSIGHQHYSECMFRLKSVPWKDWFGKTKPLSFRPSLVTEIVMEIAESWELVHCGSSWTQAYPIEDCVVVTLHYLIESGSIYETSRLFHTKPDFTEKVIRSVVLALNEGTESSKIALPIDITEWNELAQGMEAIACFPGASLAIDVFNVFGIVEKARTGKTKSRKILKGGVYVREAVRVDLNLIMAVDYLGRIRGCVIGDSSALTPEILRRSTFSQQMRAHIPKGFHAVGRRDLYLSEHIMTPFKTSSSFFLNHPWISCYNYSHQTTIKLVAKTWFQLREHFCWLRNPSYSKEDGHSFATTLRACLVLWNLEISSPTPGAIRHRPFQPPRVRVKEPSITPWTGDIEDRVWETMIRGNSKEDLEETWEAPKGKFVNLADAASCWCQEQHAEGTTSLDVALRNNALMCARRKRLTLAKYLASIDGL
ncbi:putative nuclease harbi1 [Dinochytrium kinnereticum]|nr:putative nuclease harbi1 [Dinochytrium kinnereticum]